MDAQLKMMLIPLSARNPLSCTRRAHSQPHQHLRNHKVKINLRRLPTDFFHPSLPEISSLYDSRPRQRAATQDIRRIQQTSSQKESCVLARIASNQQRRQGSLQCKVEKKKRVVSQHSINNQHQNQNSNFMNWTFSRHMFTRENQQTAKSPRQLTANLQGSINSQYKINPTQKCRSGRKKREFNDRVNNILTDKLAELNINRLKMNLRKNNHPQSYLKYVKKLCI